jgi:2-succinyl-6-hydroxy-2,4-cyclohexadiene-1-carboxylate synthase
MKIQVNGVETHYELIGDGDCLVLIHGFTDNMTMWYNQVPVFSRQYRVLAYDVRGHGQTESPDDKISLDTLADDLYALLKALNIDKAFLLGYSMGGRIGLEFALEHPDMIPGFIFANSGIPGPVFQLSEQEITEMKEKQGLMEKLIESGDIETIAEVMTEFSFSPGFKDRCPDIYQKYKDLKLKNTPKHYLPILRAIVENFQNPPDLARLKCPALIVAGNQDSFMKLDVAESMEKAIPNAQVKILPTGHAAALEMPEQFNQTVIEFLRNSIQ